MATRKNTAPKAPKITKVQSEVLDDLGFPIPAPVSTTPEVIETQEPEIPVVVAPKAEKAPREAKEAPLCLCGCLAQTSSHVRLFRQGHDARLVGFLAANERAVAKQKEAPHALTEAQITAACQIRLRKAEAAALKLPSASPKPVLEAAPAEAQSTGEQTDEAQANVG